MIDFELPSMWQLALIGDLCEPVRTENPSMRREGTFKYVDISSADNDLKIIRSASEIESRQAPSRARQIMATNDVLVSTVRPSLNAVALVPENLDGEICSTGFCVLRPNKTILNSEYLFAWVRHPAFIQLLTRLERGIGYPAVSDSDIKGLQIPLAPVLEQHRISAILREADELRRARREASEKVRDFSFALFQKMFTRYAMYDTVPLDDLTESFRYGTSIRSGDTGRPTLRISNIVRKTIDVSDLKLVPVNDRELEHLRLQDGDVLFVRSNGNPDYVGRCAVFESQFIADAGYDPTEFIFASYLIRARIKTNRIDPYFLQQYLDTIDGRKEIRSRTRTSAGQYNINTEGLGAIRVPIPPISIQHEFADRVKESRKIQASQIASERNIDYLFQSLLAEAFTGELTARWRYKYRAELERAAVEMRRQIQEKRSHAESVSIETVMPEELTDSLSKFRTVVGYFVEWAKAADWTAVLTPLIEPAFAQLANTLRPFARSLPESLNEKMAQEVAQLEPSVTDALANHTLPLINNWRQSSERYYADLLTKLALLAQLQQGQTPGRAELQTMITEVIAEAPQYWTLLDLAEDWRLNHLPRNTVREIVDMLVVMGKLRETTIRHETDDKQEPVQFIRAYTQVSDAERVAASDIQL